MPRWDLNFVWLNERKFYPDVLSGVASVLCLEKAVAPHSSTLAWQTPWMEEPGRLQSMGSLGVGHDWATSLSLFTFTHWEGNGNPLPCSWDSPGKNTGVGCHCLLQCIKVKSESEGAQSCLTLTDPMDCSPPGSSVHGVCQARVLEWGAIKT